MNDVDLVLSGRIVDGTGAPAYDGWIAVSAERIVAVEPDAVGRPEAAALLEVPGRVITPGFVDVHTHSDLAAIVAPSMDSAVRQGVTTVVVGNCGSSPAPLRAPRTASELVADMVDVDCPVSWRGFGEYLDAVQQARPAVNVAALVGFGALRRLVLDDPLRPATHGEALAMLDALRRCLDEGAAGLSTGLIYDPDRHAPPEEVLTVASGLGRGIYASHIRGEGEPVVRAVEEALEVGRRCGVQVQVSHLKCESAHSWGRMPQLLELLREARRSGIDAWADSYPYAAYETELAAFLPPWAPPDRLPSLLATRTDRERLRRAVEHGEPDWQSSVDGVGWERVVVDQHADPSCVGHDLATLAGSGDVLDTVGRLLQRDPQTFVIGHAMCEDDVRLALAAPDVMVASDGVALPTQGPLSTLTLHPRCWGTFPRVLGHYVRDERVLPLETAVHAMTQLPAERFGLTDRGVLRPGAFADVVVLDPAAVAGPADFGTATEPPLGIDTVLVNGRTAWSGGRLGERAGQVLRDPKGAGHR